MSPEEALDREVAYEEDGLFAGVTYSTAKVRAVLAEVSPEPGGVLDRDQARPILDTLAPHAYGYEIDAVLDRLAGCVRPVAIDRDAFLAMLEEIEDGDHLFDQDDLYQGVLALVRPVAGVTLTPEEAALAAEALRLYGVRDATVNTLAARLEAGS